MTFKVKQLVFVQKLPKIKIQEQCIVHFWYGTSMYNWSANQKLSILKTVEELSVK